jgi:lysyl-tRNA synthetase class 2
VRLAFGPRSGPYRYPKDASAAAIAERFAGLEAGARSGESVRVAGRLLLVRRQGGVCFADLKDSSGRIQLFFEKSTTECYEEVSEITLGDWVGAEGEVVRTKRGELSVLVRSFTVLARPSGGLWDKYHGIRDPEYRYRHREADLASSEEAFSRFKMRSEIVRQLRELLWSKGFIEVETPILQPVAGGALARPFVTHHNALNMDLYLRVAPELYLKRLIVGGFEKVFELGRAFRNEGISPRHNPEFTILELYQAFSDYEDLIPLTEEILASVSSRVLGRAAVQGSLGEISLEPPYERRRLVELVSEAVGEKLTGNEEPQEMRALCERFGLEAAPHWGPGKLLLELYEKLVEPKLRGPVFVMDYPQEVSPLARPHREVPGFAERFELVVDGRELANAFSELTDPDLQRKNFEAQLRLKAAGEEESMEFDRDFIDALALGMPPTAGLGIGVDRLAMLLLGQDSIKEVILFPLLRPADQDQGADGAS